MDNRHDELVARLDALAARVSELEDAVRAGRQLAATMKRKLRCPDCGHRKILYASPIGVDPAYGKNSSPLAVASSTSRWGKVSSTGVFEVFACIACGLAEWHIASPDEAAKLLRVIDGEAPESGGPFR